MKKMGQEELIRQGEIELKELVFWFSLIDVTSGWLEILSHLVFS